MAVPVIGRPDYGAQAPRGSMALASYPMRQVYLHHSVTRSDVDSRAAARQIQNIAFSRGFSDTSYTFLFHRNGDVLEGRNLRYVGAHTGGFNSVSLGFCIIGNYDGEDPSDAQINRVGEMREELIARGFLVPGTYPTGGHRDTGFATSCPGSRAYTRLGDFRRAASSKPTQVAEDLERPDMFLILTEGNVFLVGAGAPDGQGGNKALAWIDGADVGALEAKLGKAVPVSRATANSILGQPI